MPEEHTTSQTNDTSAQVVTGKASRNALAIPAAIVIAAALIAGAIYISSNTTGPSVNVQGGIDKAQNTQETPETVVAPITESDHIKGNPNAPIVIVEYSDFDCPFCKNFHETMTKIIDKFGADGKVAWVYRQFPIVQLHPNAPKIAAASECVAELGGNDAFWKFADQIFGQREVNAQTNVAKLTEYAVAAGVEKSAFENCSTSGKHDETIKTSIDAAVAAGARGTPYSIVLVGDEQGIINGAQPYDVVESIVENLIGQLESGKTD